MFEAGSCKVCEVKSKFWTKNMAGISSPDLDDKTLKRYISEQPKLKVSLPDSAVAETVSATA